MSDILTEIRRLVAEAERISTLDWNDETSDAYDALHEALDALDKRAGPGLAVGRVLHFHAGDGLVDYLIDRIDDSDPLRVHCAWVANSDEYTADAVDGDGFCLRSVAEAQIRRREGW